MQRCFGSVINRPPSIGYDAGDGPDLDDGPLGPPEERHEGLAEAHHGEDVGVEDRFDLGYFGFDGWNGVIWILSVYVHIAVVFLSRSLLTPASIVHQVVQSSPRSF